MKERNEVMYVGTIDVNSTVWNNSESIPTILKVKRIFVLVAVHTYLFSRYNIQYTNYTHVESHIRARTSVHT